jgi:hypothetical protein
MGIKLKIILLIFSLALLTPAAFAATINTYTDFTGHVPARTQAGALYLRCNLNIDYPVRIYNENDFSLNSQTCQGRKITIETTQSCVESCPEPQGEWESERGGFYDSPPIFWVNDLDAVISKIQSSPKTGPNINPSDGYVDPETGIPVYSISPKPVGHVGFETASGFGTVVCEANDAQVSVTGAQIASPGVYEVTAGDNEVVNIDVSVNVRCIFYFFGEYGKSYASGGFVISRAALLPGKAPIVGSASAPSTGNTYSVGTIQLHASLLSSNMPPSLEVTPLLTSEQISAASSTFLKAVITNTGGASVNLMNLNLNTPSTLFNCNSKTLSPGTSTECIFLVAPQSSTDLQLNLNYKSTDCGERKSYSQSFLVGRLNVFGVQCEKDSECTTGNICCNGECKDPAQGVCADIDGDGIPEWVPRSAY